MNDMTTKIDTATMMEQVLIRGDLSRLTPQERSDYMMAVCKSLGLNPLTKPFEFITLNGKLVLYALKAATDQLRTIHKVSVIELTESDWDGVYIVTAKVQNAEGRTDSAKGAVNIQGLRGEAMANAIMKAETKAKRRATLSICGLGMLDETEVEDIPAAAKAAPIKEPPKTLPKKDCKHIYTKLQAEVDGAQSREWLREWAEGNAERIAILPEDWQDILRLRYREQMLDLQNKEIAVPDHDKDGVIWDEEGERPAMPADRGGYYPEIPKDDGLDIPDYLQRKRSPVPPHTLNGMPR